MSQTKGKWVWWDGEFRPREAAVVPIDWHVLRYGSSVFEGMRCYDTRRGAAIPFLPEHAQRLWNSAKIHGMTDKLKWAPQQIAEAIIATVRKNGIAPCYVNPMIFRGGGTLNVSPLGAKVVATIDVMVWGSYVGDAAQVMITSWRRAPAGTFPSMAKAGGNYLLGSLIKVEAIRHGYDEGVALTSDGYVSDGSGENIFLVYDGELWTPPISDCGLPGLTRKYVIKLARDFSWTVREERVPPEMLYIAEELFFTGSAAEITPIALVDHHEVPAPGPKTKLLQEAFRHTIDGKTKYSDGWITYFNM